MLDQPRFDFSQFNAQTAQFYLMVEPPQVLDDAIHPLAYQIPGAVQTLALIERAWHKALSGQRRPAMIIAGQPCTAQIQFTRNAQRNGR